MRLYKTGSAAANVWERSPNAGNSNNFCNVNNSGTANNNNANNVNSVSPDFATLRWEGQTQ